MKPSVPEQKSLSARLADLTGLHVNIISELQRCGALPRDLNKFSAEDVLFIKHFKKIFGNREILRLQLARITQKEREYLAKNPGDWQLKNWEVWVISRFMTLYKKKSRQPEYRIDTNQVIEELRKFFQTLPTPWVARRVSKLRQIAARRFKASRGL